MMVLKGCTRCGGDLMQERAIGEEADLACLQCGKVHYQTAAAALEPRQPGRRAPRFGGRNRAA